MAFNILIVDDEADIRELVSGILGDNGYNVETASCYIEAVRVIQRGAPSLIILDVWLNDSSKDSQRILELVCSEYAQIPIIMISGHGTIETAVSAIRHGAYDFIEKPFSSHRLITSIEKALEAARLAKENADLKVKARVSNAIVGKSSNVISIRKSIEQIGSLSGRCVIIGPYGSEKETIAREIHRLSNRAKNPFEHVACGAYGSRQLEAEFFGTEIKTPSGTQIKQGLLEKACGGTLFVEELTLTPPGFQNKFLMMLKEGAFTRTGSGEKIPTNARIIAGFMSNIEQLVKERTFNGELYCRLSANVIKILPLRSRREDIQLLLDHFMEQSAKAHNLPPRKFSNAAFGVLNNYAWPGDVLQLKNVVDWVLTFSAPSASDSNVVSVDDLPGEIVGVGTSNRLEVPIASDVTELTIREARVAFEREYFIGQLRKFAGSVSRTAEFVGMDRTALHRKLKSLKINGSKTDTFKDATDAKAG